MAANGQRLIVVGHVSLRLVVALAVFFSRLFHDLTWTVIHCFLLNSRLCIGLALVWVLVFFNGFSIDGKPIKVFQVGKVAHDQVDLIFSLKVDVQASQDGKSAN